MDSRHCRWKHYCTCRTCRPRAQTVGLPLPYVPTQELLSQLKTFSAAVIANYKTLCLRKAKLSPHIAKRWSAMALEKRKQLGRRLGSQIPDLHRPEPDAYDTLVGKQDLTDGELERLHGILSCPYWTVEEICHRDNLLLLLERRTSSPPGYFAAFDLE